MSSDGHIPRERIPLIFVADLLPQYRRDYTFYIALSFDPPGVWAPHLVFDNPSRAEPGIKYFKKIREDPENTALYKGRGRERISLKYLDKLISIIKDTSDQKFEHVFGKGLYRDLNP